MTATYQPAGQRARRGVMAGLHGADDADTASGVWAVGAIRSLIVHGREPKALRKG